MGQEGTETSGGRQAGGGSWLGKLPGQRQAGWLWAQDVSQDSVHVRALPVNHDDDLPYSIIMCLDLVTIANWSIWTPLHLQSQREIMNTNKQINHKKYPPLSLLFFFSNVSFQIPNLFQEFFCGYSSWLTAKIRRPVTTTDTRSPSHLHFQTLLLKGGKKHNINK